MRQDINDLKCAVHGMASGQPDVTVIPAHEYITTIPPSASKGHAGRLSPAAMDTEEVKDETLSLQEKEEEMIRKALERHRGKRKLAAQELGISERTLYRKIKEYQIDNQEEQHT